VKMTAGKLICFMCEVPVYCRDGNFSKLDAHLKLEHKIKRGNNYLLAGCFMNEEERDAVKDVINDKIEQAFKTTNEPKKEGSVRFRCTHCPISFTMKDNLNEHLLRKHKVKVTNKSGVKITPVVSSGSKPNNMKRKSLPNVKFEKVSQQVDEHENEEDDSDPLTSTPERKKSRRSEMKRDLSQKVKVVGKRTSGGGMVAEPDEDPGNGLTCPLCQKEFQSNGPMRRHFEDIHQPGEYPCRGCNKVFSSKNKMSSHYSRNCKSRRSL